MKRTWLVIPGVLLLLTVLGLYGCAGQGTATGGVPAAGAAPVGAAANAGALTNSQQTGLWASGKGQATAAPDVANVSLGVQAQAAIVADAQSQAANAMNGVMTALTGNGVATKDIQTQNFNIQQLTRYDTNKQQSVVIGYQVTNTVAAKIRALDKVGTIIDAVAKAGGDLTRINNISFSVDNPTPYYKDARQKAMADAKAKADQMAGLAGVKLGKPIYISESSYIPSPTPTPMLRAEAAAAAQTPISPGETKISVNVQVVYPILQ